MTRDREVTGVNPSHYRKDGQDECIDIIRRMVGDNRFIGFCLANMIKHRYRAKSEADYDKARWYEQMAMHVHSDRDSPCWRSRLNWIPDPRVKLLSRATITRASRLIYPERGWDKWRDTNSAVNVPPLFLGRG
jgi:hypothetical protein